MVHIYNISQEKTNKQTNKHGFESVVVRWMNLDPVLHCEVSQKEKNKHCILTHIYVILKKIVLMNLFSGKQWRYKCR